MNFRRWLILIGFALLAVPGRAQTCLDDLSVRLETRLRALPDRWDKIPQPVIPVSGRSSEEILATASEEEKALVSEWITFLALSPPAERAELIRRELQARPLSEVDVWLPERFTDDLRTTNQEELTLYVEAWLEWAEALGRKDALLVAAGLALGRLSRLRGESRSLLETASRWAGLPPSDHDARGRADVLSQYARRLFKAGENEKAIAVYRSARKLFEQVGDRRRQGFTFRGEARVMYRLGESEKALDIYRHAHKLFEQVGDQEGQADILCGEADIMLYQLGESEKALDAYKRARRLFEQVGDRMGQGNTFRGEADVLIRLGDNEKALDAYRSARNLLEEVEDSLGLGDTFLGEAALQYQLGNKRNAKSLASQAVAAYRKAGAVDSERTAWLVTAEVELSSGNLEPAVLAAREAVRLHAVARSNRISETHRAHEDEDISDAYDILVPVLLLQTRTEQALAAAEEARSHVLLDLLAGGSKQGNPGAAIDLRAERRRLVSELAQLETESRQAADADRLAELQRLRNRIDRDLDWNQYQTLAAEQDALLTAQPLDAAGIRAVARETGPILLYYAADKELIGFLVPADGTDVFAARIEVSRDHLAEAVQRYIHDEANPFYAERAAQQSRELWNLLLAPFAAHLPAHGPLVIVPHGALHELPFETLVDPTGTPLFERWMMSFAPSVSTLARARERHKEPQPKDFFLAFSSGHGLELPQAEAGEVAELFGNDKAAFKPTEASFENYEHLVPGARQLLISTNGTWVPGDQRKTYLEILPTRDVHDSRLSVAEIAAIPLSAELVALEACDTERGETRSNDERLDLTRAFLTAGAASVLATRWKVPDEPATTRFLLDFYRAYRQGGPGGPGGKGLRKDQALTAARRRSRERGDPAQVWAAWVLVGDAR